VNSGVIGVALQACHATTDSPSVADSIVSASPVDGLWPEDGISITQQGTTCSHAARLFRPGVCLLVILSLAATFRLYSLGYNSLSHAEAWRANWSYNGGLDEARRFPPLQYALGYATQHILGRSELIVRLPYALAGVACVVVLYLFVRRYFGKWPAVAVAAVAAFHPVLILHSQQLKVFSLETLCTPLVLWAGFEAYRRTSIRSLNVFTAMALVALGFTFTSSLVIAAWIPMLAWVYMRRDDVRGLHRRFLAVMGLLALFGAGWYFWLAGCPCREAVSQYYDTMIPTWPQAYTLKALGTWLFTQSYGAVRYVLAISSVWAPLNWAIATLEILAIAASMGVLWRRCRPLCVVVLILGVEVILAGALRLWPFGHLRHTTFLIPLVSIGIGCGLYQLVRRLGLSPATVILIGVCILIPMARAAKATIVSPRVEEHVRPVLDYITTRIEPGDAIFVYYATAPAFEFYWRDQTVPVLLQPGPDRDRLPVFARRFDRWIKQHGRVWYVLTHPWRDEGNEWISHLKSDYDLLDKIGIGDASAHLLTLRTRPRQQEPPP